MRTPLQILFLILVTDLPPSIALGMEPGESTILKQRPRPKEEPIVLGWMWVSICLNGVFLSICIIAVFVASLSQYCGNIFQKDILDDSNLRKIASLVSTASKNDYDSTVNKISDSAIGGSCTEDGLDFAQCCILNARTVAFISLVYSENIRAYTSRSFDQPFWVNLCGNRQMQYAIVAAQIALYIAVLVPFVNTKILGLNAWSIGAWGWVVSIAGPIGTVILCESAKILTSIQIKQYQGKLKKAHDEEMQRQNAELAIVTANKARAHIEKQLELANAVVEELRRNSKVDALRREAESCATAMQI